MQREVAIWRLIDRSQAAQRVLSRRNQIEAALRQQKRKVWPTATAAKLLGLTPSLLRKWVRDGTIRPTVHPPVITGRE